MTEAVNAVAQLIVARDGLIEPFEHFDFRVSGREGHDAMTFRFRRMNWGTSVDNAIALAIGEFQLRNGWKAFEAQEWVQELIQLYPAMKPLAELASTYNDQGYLQKAEDLFLSAAPEDRPGIENYFIGKLGLEELSCRMHGAGAGACDKKGAFLQIFELYKRLLNEGAAGVGAENGVRAV
jgi:hypothetical protein